MKQIEVTILGQGYLLACPEGGETRLEAAVATVDREMTAIRDAGRIRARERIAVLAALNIAYQLAERQSQGRAMPPGAPGAETPERSAAGSALEADPAGQSAVWQALLARIDTALTEDGHLI